MINLVSRNLHRPLVLAGGQGKQQLQKLFLIQCNNICHKNDLDPESLALRLPPFPYTEKRLNFAHRYLRVEGFNATIGRFTENTKVVVVEGNIGAGKGPLAKKLAEDLGMKFFPDVTPEDDYLASDGFDWRNMNKHLPEDVWYPDHRTVLETRNPYQAGYWEMAMLRMRSYNYLLALTHMLNTGDGVVLERSAWSGTVFARTLRDLNFVSQDFLTHYWDIRSAAFARMYRPHVVIYLDVPVDKCLENVKKNNTHGTGPLLDEEYLQTVEKNYKKHFLPIIEEHAEMFTYNLNEPVTEETATDLSELIVDDLSKSDMDAHLVKITSGEEKFEDWRFFDSDERFTILRHEITKNKEAVLKFFEIYPYYVDELWPAYQMIFARDHLTDELLERRENERQKTLTFRQKMFGEKTTWAQDDAEGWFVKTGYPPDYFQAER